MDPFHWKELLSFSQRERRGIYTLLLILFLLLLFKGYRNDLIPPKEPASDSLFSLQVEEWLREAQPPESTRLEQVAPTRGLQQCGEEIRLFRFNPNQASRQELERLGLSARVVNNLLKYREKGGSFDSPGELLKIYGMDSSTYLLVKDSVCIEQEPQTNKPVSTASYLVPRDTLHHVHVDLNAADTFELMLLPGIGEVYARRICKYRDLLGGYVNAGQLREVYGLNPALVDTLKRHLHIDTLKIRHIAINQATFREFIRHPYLGEYHTQAILNYRNYRQARVEHIDELLKHNILDQKTYHKIQPYLVAEPGVVSE